MKADEVDGLFALAGFERRKTWKLENNYWPDSAHYDQIRKDCPWWLVKTQYGLIEIGWRKRVISIDWSDTGVKYGVPDDVTKSNTSAHAWSIEKALEYLRALRAAAEASALERREGGGE